MKTLLFVLSLSGAALLLGVATDTGIITAPAAAAPQLSKFIVADQVADAPATPDQSSDQSGGKATAPKQSTSKKLSESNGVIHPPPTGDHAVVTPPPTEPTNKAVIPPPGTPGGDPNVQPK